MTAPISALALRLVAVLAAALALAGAARADAGVALRPAPVAHGDIVTLGEVFDGLGEKADLPLARAPAPGRVATVTPEWLARAAARHGVRWRNAEGVRRIAIRRASQIVAAAEIETLIAEALQAQAPDATWRVRLAAGRDLHASTEAVLAPEVTAIQHGSAGRLAAVIRLSPDLAPRTVAATAERAITIPVLARPIARGEVISAQDVAWVERSSSAVGRDAIRDAAEVIGMAAKRSLRADAHLTVRDLAAPAAVRKGEPVVLLYEVGRIRLTARGRALSDAAAGAPARFVNLQSNQIVEAIADGPGLARVPAAAMMIVGGR